MFNLSQSKRRCRSCLPSLALAAIVTTIAGAVVGRWAARRTLAPLRNASRAALAIANGQLDTRLEARDESDLAVLASSFNTMVDRLQERIERDARFTSDVSHELRSPLTTLATSLSIMESRRDELPERAQQALDLLSAETQRFQRMVAALLEISRLDAGSADFQPSTLRIGELVQRAIESCNATDVPLVIADELAARTVEVDKRRFERIIANLIQNAERHAGGATRIRVLGCGDFLRIEVDDAGPGVAADERQRIFERFARGSAQRVVAGVAKEPGSVSRSSTST